jgi:hypothetical protein
MEKVYDSPITAFHLAHLDINSLTTSLAHRGPFGCGKWLVNRHADKSILPASSTNIATVFWALVTQVVCSAEHIGTKLQLMCGV